MSAVSSEEFGSGSPVGSAHIVCAACLTSIKHRRPFTERSAAQAAEAIEALRVSVDTLIVIPNDKLLDGMLQLTPSLASPGLVCIQSLLQNKPVDCAESPQHIHAALNTCCRKPLLH